MDLDTVYQNWKVTWNKNSLCSDSKIFTNNDEYKLLVAMGSSIAPYIQHKVRQGDIFALHVLRDIEFEKRVQSLSPYSSLQEWAQLM